MILSNKTLDTIIVLSNVLSDIAKNGKDFKSNLTQLVSAKKQADSSLSKLAEQQRSLDSSIEEINEGMEKLGKEKAKVESGLNKLSTGNAELVKAQGVLAEDQEASSIRVKVAAEMTNEVAVAKESFEKSMKSALAKLAKREAMVSKNEAHINEIQNVMNRGN